jgi:hypothetical protein
MQTTVLPRLVGGRDPAGRFAIHRLHFEASLVKALMEKFPATTWLVGTSFMTDAARAFAHCHPPAAPCIADYGADFPRFIGTRPETAHIPALLDFAETEWQVGRVSIAISRPPIAIDAFSKFDANVLPALALQTHPGLFYRQSAWPIDDLLKLYLSDNIPDHHVFEPLGVHLEISGARGDFQLKRLSYAEFLFRRAISEGATIGDAAEQALACDPEFDPGRAFATLIADSLVTGIANSAPSTGRTSQ